MTKFIVARKLQGIATYSEQETYESALALWEDFRGQIKLGDTIRLWEVKPLLTAVMERDDGEPAWEQDHG